MVYFLVFFDLDLFLAISDTSLLTATKDSGKIIPVDNPAEQEYTKTMADQNTRPLEWPVAAIWISLFLCVTAVIITLILVP